MTVCKILKKQIKEKKMSNENIEDRLLSFIGEHSPALTPEKRRELSEVLYTVSELGLWPDSVSSVSEDQALLVYQVVLAIKSKDLPDELVL
jgi:hypothetical protein